MPETPETVNASHPLESPSFAHDVTVAPVPAEAAGAEPEEGEEVTVTVRVRAPHPTPPTTKGKLFALIAPALDIALALARRLLMRWP